MRLLLNKFTRKTGVGKSSALIKHKVTIWVWGGLPGEKGSNLGEWRVMFTKQRTFFESLLGKNKLLPLEKVLSLVMFILKSANFQNVQLNESA